MQMDRFCHLFSSVLFSTLGFQSLLAKRQNLEDTSQPSALSEEALSMPEEQPHTFDDRPEEVSYLQTG